MEALGEPSAPPDEERRPSGRVTPGRELLARASLAGVVSQLTNGLAHETRNSLNALAIHLEVLADKLREPGSETVPAHLEKNLQAARAQIRRLDDTMRRFGEFAAGRTEARDVAWLFSNAANLCAYHLRRTGTEVAIDVPEGAFPRGDPAVLSQLAVEVLLGASTVAGGRRLRIDGAFDGDRLDLRIALEGTRFVPPEGVVTLAGALGGAVVAHGGSPLGWEMSLPLANRERPG